MPSSGFAQAGPLPSWNDGSTKSSLLEFIELATDEGGEHYIETEDRIAVFDNDGTLWSEQPLYFQLAFALDRVKALAPSHPEWQNTEPYQSVLAGDMAAVVAGGEHALLEIVMATHAGMTTEEFEQIVSAWVATARHPKTERLYTEMVYQPMLELLAHLRANDFKTYIVSGGGIEFMRPWAERVYGIPPEQVIGSSIHVEFQSKDGEPVLMRLPKMDFIDDKQGKPVAINKFIGRRPALAFGNSDGDLQMLQWAHGGAGSRLMGLVRHTDAEREWAYDRDSSIGRLDKALDEARAHDWLVVDMKRDWNVIYPFDMK